jgi:hypothetical protein
MKILTTKTHGFIDYSAGIAMIISPWVLGIHQPLAAYILIVAGVISIIRNVLTDYEFGLACQTSMQHHLRVDILSGLLLASCPLFLNLTLPATHIVFGLFQALIALISQNVPSYKGYQGFVYKKFEKFPSMKYQDPELRH